MPETVDTAREIVKVKREIQDIRQSQDADMQLNREKYLELVSHTLTGNPARAKVFLEVDGLKSRREIQDSVGGAQATVWRAIDVLEGNGLITKLEESKGGSPVYSKPRWVRTLRIDDYVRQNFLSQQAESSEDHP